MQELQQHLAALLGRHRRWLMAAAALPFFGVVAAFGTAPDTVTADVPRQTVIESIQLPEPVATEQGSFDFWREERIQRGDTLASLLNRMGVAGDEIPRILTASRETGAMVRLIPGRTVLGRVTAQGRLLMFRYMASEDKLVTVERSGDGFQAREEVAALETRLVMRTGTVRNSLFGATDAADVPDTIASQLAEVFSGEIDFHRDLRQGDRFSVVYETLTHAGGAVKTGRLLAAEFVNQGQAYRAVYFRDPQGVESYFTPDGKSLKRAFLKSPMPFTRISSGFSSARYHPVLKEWRAHRGIDYAAPTGTPIRAVSDATVDFVGRRGGYGNLVVLNHQRPYSTAYGHLSRFAPGIRRGARVGQGQIIGYVGSTGLATGPHLHYEFRINGTQTNPLALKLPNSLPLEGRYRARFAAEAAPLVARLNLLTEHRVAGLD